MQLLRSTAEMEGFPKTGDLFDPMQNVFIGAKHLAGLLKRYNKKIPFAAAAYNAGADATEKWRARFPSQDLQVWTEAITYPETRDYVKKILFAKKMYDEILHEH
jgi:soluble lytic murein transglycosylase